MLNQHLDSLPELLNCSKLTSEVCKLSQHIQNSVKQTKHSQIFSSDINLQKQATDTYTLLLSIREQLLDTPLAVVTSAAPAPGAPGPLHISGNPSDIVQ